MLQLTEAGLLDLWYVVLSESGDEVSRHKHPETAPVGSPVTNWRGDDPESFTVEPDDVYVMFSPTERLARLTNVLEGGDPKAEGAASASASAPVPGKPTEEEQASKSPRWTGQAIELHIHLGDQVSGDKIGRDKIMGDRVEGDKVGRDKKVESRDTQYIGDHGTVTNQLQGERKRKTGSAVAIALGVLVALGAIGLFVWLGSDGRLEWIYALPAAAISSAAVLAITNMVASHLRG
jgi:hypothetical protein